MTRSAPGRRIGSLRPGAEPAELPLADAPPSSLPFELAAIQVRTNGVDQPLAFLDTGGQHTLMTLDAARAAGVRLGSAGTHLTGFVGLQAQPAVIETLELGSLTLHNVPVLVGDSPPLVAAGGQMSLGTDLMHHVRFTIDYPARRVTAVPAGAPGARARTTAAVGDSRVDVLAGVPGPRTNHRRGAGPGACRHGRSCRDVRFVPVGTAPPAAIGRPELGDGVPLQETQPGSWMLKIGSQSLVDWPVLDTIPNELDRLNLVDVMLGHDLLWPYRLMIDLGQRTLQLHPGTESRRRTGRHRDLGRGERRNVMKSNVTVSANRSLCPLWPDSAVIDPVRLLVPAAWRPAATSSNCATAWSTRTSSPPALPIPA